MTVSTRAHVFTKMSTKNLSENSKKIFSTRLSESILKVSPYVYTILYYRYTYGNHKPTRKVFLYIRDTYHTFKRPKLQFWVFDLNFLCLFFSIFDLVPKYLRHVSLSSSDYNDSITLATSLRIYFSSSFFFLLIFRSLTIFS